MSSKRRLVKAIKILSRRFSKFSKKYLTAINKLINWLLRTLFITWRRRESANAGFVLPTVAMVALVVVLLTTAILFRSFDRSKNASNVRVNQAVLNAAMPAIDRAKAKIEELFNDRQNLPLSTPTDGSLYNAFTKDSDSLKKYTFGDETPLTVTYDVNENNGIDAATDSTDIEDRETIKTAWRFPVDTDNNGRYDSYTVYGIYFRSPSRDDKGKFDRARNPLDARTPPMDDGSLGDLCSAAKGTSASLVGESGWYKSGANIKKSFFVYSATVPITSDPTDSTKFEKYKGNKGFSAVEFQQDQERTPISNNAVVYEDDLEITPGSGLNINGRIFTNSNLLTAKTNTKTDGEIRYYQVSSPKSCFYKAQNSKIIVGGNVGNGRITGDGEGNEVLIDLFKILPKDKSVNDFNIGQTKINGTNKSANNKAGEIAFNTQAYAQRINSLVVAQTGSIPSDYSKDPKEVQENIEARIKENPGLEKADVRREELEAYFKKRTRKVPFVEVGLGIDAGTASLQDAGTEKLRPQDNWIYPVEGTTDYTKLKLNVDKLEATEPTKLKEVNKEQEKYLGDRVLVGNNLPALWFDKTIKDFVGRKTTQQLKPDTEWKDWEPYDKFKYRTRSTKIEQLISLAGATERDGYFELQATQKPKNALDNVGGMRVVTGAGIYVDGNTGNASASYLAWDGDADSIAPGVQLRSFLAPSHPITLDSNFVGTDANRIKVDNLKFNGKDPIIVFPDSMPMTTGGDVAGNLKVKGDLQMRATAVYFYKDASDKDYSGRDQMPIACVSSYYDPTNAITAQNQLSVLTSWKNPDADQTAIGGLINGKSNNGVVYPPYSGTRTSAISTYNKQLEQQARLVFPDGRFVNEPLRDALEHNRAGKSLSMADNSAIDTAVCAIQILDGTLTASASPPVPHGAIYETAFLDARQIKAIENRPNVAELTDLDYTRSIEERQPLEVRVTVLDIDKLRKTKIGSTLPQEYLLANSGIIYATRDDALPDLSDPPNNKIENRKLISPTDYKLDPTRRPNGIMLVNGSSIQRESNYRDAEKGLILATNVPAYIKGNFNLHSRGGDPTKPVEEFKKQLRNDKTGEIDWNEFYKRDALDDDFACRKGDPRLPKDKCQNGDSWRSATVLADAVTILSDNFRFGFRNEGDYDLRNNQGDVKSDDYKKQGFFANNFLTSSEWFESSSYPKDFDSKTDYQGSSYVNNFVTPIQRRVNFGEYVMEICRKVPVSTCGADDWKVGLDTDGNLKTAEEYKKASETKVGIEATKLVSGTTARVANNDEDKRYARRVAFLRDPSNNKLVLDKNKAPVPIGIDKDGKLAYYPYSELKIPVNSTNKNFDATSTDSPVTISAYNAGDDTKRPRYQPNALWFRTTDDTTFTDNPTTKTNYGKKFPLFYSNKLLFTTPFTPPKGDYQQGSDEQPLLVPVLQIQMPYDEWTKSSNDPGDDRPDLPVVGNRGVVQNKNWLQQAIPTTTNLVIAGGDSPGRPSESNGGLENFVRYLEKWQNGNLDTSPGINSNISGSLIQYKRSAYATAPWQFVQLDASKNPRSTSIFGSDYGQFYKTNSNTVNDKFDGRSPFYTAPSRQWGFDVALLSQLPDLFAQQFTIPPASKPNEFFREVSRDDEWVKTLLCAKTPDKKDAVPKEQRPTEFCKSKTGD